MGIRQQFLKAYHKCPFTAIRDVVIPLVSWIFDIVLYCHLANEYSKSITKEAEFACRQSHNIKVQRACRHLSTDLHAAPVFFLSCVTHTVVVYSIFYGFPRTWFIRRFLKLGTYNLVCIGVVLYGYFYSEIAFETSLPFLIIRVFVCIVYHIFTSVMWCCDKWCRKGDKRKPEKNEELVVEQLQVTTVHIHSGKTRLQRLREIQSRRTVSEEQPNEILVTTPKKLCASASLP